MELPLAWTNPEEEEEEKSTTPQEGQRPRGELEKNGATESNDVKSHPVLEDAAERYEIPDSWSENWWTLPEEAGELLQLRKVVV
ncbi:hypothetical protein NDU88_003417 [Pleurodeles waltl]|uniref:Uncharacterized protein n=1 Tax=Pleurodeles waltl TaxID=8319 RepID=A0AAV7QBN9_PLEWA|nr:hypothetical protein NDU88_003417 [Pleurodeles waltl]